MPFLASDAPTESVRGAKYVIYTGAEEWDALYVDGRLKTVGDSYLIDEEVRELLGCVQVDSDAYFLGGKGHYEDVATTLDEVEDYRIEVVLGVREKRERAEALRAEAAQLEAEAKELETRSGW